jgi:hypothetical protein
MLPLHAECFGVPAQTGFDIAGSYEAIGSERSVKVTLSPPEEAAPTGKGKELFTDTKSSSAFRASAGRVICYIAS